MSDFYYSFDFDFDNYEMKIGVDDSNVYLKFRDCNKITPSVKSLSDGYKLSLTNIYNEINIEYYLKKDSIKEVVIVKNRKSDTRFFVDIKKENCEMYFSPIEKKFAFNDKKGNELFSIPLPEVINRPTRDKRLIDKYIDIKYGKDYIYYYFDNSIPEQFPVIIDPGFVFATSIKKGASYHKDMLSRFNNMILTGTSYGNRYAQNELVFSSYLRRENFVDPYVDFTQGMIYSMSDDVLFENRLRLIFPWVNSGDISVYIKNKDNVKFRNDNLIDGLESLSNYSITDKKSRVNTSPLIGITDLNGTQVYSFKMDPDLLSDATSPINFLQTEEDDRTVVVEEKDSSGSVVSTTNYDYYDYQMYSEEDHRVFFTLNGDASNPITFSLFDITFQADRIVDVDTTIYNRTISGSAQSFLGFIEYSGQWRLYYYDITVSDWNVKLSPTVANTKVQVTYELSDGSNPRIEYDFYEVTNYAVPSVGTKNVMVFQNSGGASDEQNDLVPVDISDTSVVVTGYTIVFLNRESTTSTVEFYTENNLDNSVSLGVQDGQEGTTFILRDLNTDFESLTTNPSDIKISLSGVSDNDPSFFTFENDEYDFVDSEGDRIKFIPPIDIQGFEGSSLQSENFDFSIFYATANSNVNFAYVDIDVGEFDSGPIDINCTLDTNLEDIKPLKFQRRINYIKNAHIEIPNIEGIVTGSQSQNKEIIDLKGLRVKHHSAFKPNKYILIPFYFKKDDDFSFIDNFDFYAKTDSNDLGKIALNFGEATSLDFNTTKMRDGVSEFVTIGNLTTISVPTPSLSDIQLNYSLYEKKISKLNKRLTKDTINDIGTYIYRDESVFWEDYDIDIDSHLVIFENSIDHNKNPEETNTVLRVVGWNGNSLYLRPPGFTGAVGSLPILYGGEIVYDENGNPIANQSGIPAKIISPLDAISKGFSDFKYNLSKRKESYFSYSTENDFFVYFDEFGLSFDSGIDNAGKSHIVVLSGTKSHNGVYRVSYLFNSQAVVFSDLDKDPDNIENLYLNGSNTYTNPIEDSGNGIRFQILDLRDVSGGESSNDFSGIKGALNSFYNEMEVVLKSAINQRSNVQEHKRFFRPYKYLSPSDFEVGISNIQSQSIDLQFKLKPYMHFQTNNKTLSNLEDDGFLEIKEMLENIDKPHTVLNMKINFSLFDQDLDGDYRVTFLKEGETQKVNKVFNFNSFSTNILKGSYIVFEENNILRISRILSNNDRKLIINGKIASALKRSNIFSIFFFDPSKVRFRDDLNLEDKTALLKKNQLEADTGKLLYENITYSSTISQLESIEVDFISQKGNNILSKTINII